MNNTEPMPHLHPKHAARTQAFTLIELLIVVAIIGTLAALALPNFLQAQVRAKVASVQSDLGTLAAEAEIYRIDHNGYPPHREQATCTELPYHQRYAFFTTPIAYITGILYREVFAPKRQSDAQEDIADTLYVSWTNFWSFECRTPAHALWTYRHDHTYLIRSRGPDTVLEPDSVRNAHFTSQGLVAPNSFVYDPTNGATSRGEIFRTRKQWN